MPFVADLARTRAKPVVRPPKLELIASTSLARASSLRRWISAAWRLIAK